jgi:MSHA biogenesis protein MshP
LIISPEEHMPREKGFAIIVALFVLVTLAGLGAAMLSVTTSQHSGQAQDILAVRALQAARSGLDWGVFQVSNNTAGTFATTCASGPASQTLSALPGLTGFWVDVGCTSTAYSEGLASPRIYALVATACNVATCPNDTTPNAQYVERQLVASVEN